MTKYKQKTASLEPVRNPAEFRWINRNYVLSSTERHGLHPVKQQGKMDHDLKMFSNSELPDWQVYLFGIMAMTIIV